MLDIKDKSLNVKRFSSPSSFTHTRASLFSSCFALEAVKLSANMGLIDESTFEGCRSLKTVDMPKRLVKIGRRAFSGCASLEMLILPVTLREIGFVAFASCTSLSRIAIPKGIKVLEDEDVFGGCDMLSEITYGGTKEEWEHIMHGKTLTLQRNDLSLSTPKISFLDLKNEV